MTAESLAISLQAKRIGRGRWQAHCPSHSDRSPSLSIGDGRNGRVLVHCHAGCSTAAVLKHLKISVRDLFPGPPPSRSQFQARQAEREMRERARREEALWLSEGWSNVRKWEAVVGVYIESLVREPERGEARSESLGYCFDKLHEAEQEAVRREAAAKRKGRREEQYERPR